MADKTGSKSPTPDPERLGQQVLQALAKLVGCPAEGVTALRRTDDGWVVVAEVLEVERLPETTDVLASYEVTVSRDGEILGFERVRRYKRAQTEGV